MLASRFFCSLPVASAMVVLPELFGANAEGGLDLYEDHYVRKIAHLLYVPNTQTMLARNRARTKASDSKQSGSIRSDY